MGTDTTVMMKRRCKFVVALVAMLWSVGALAQTSDRARELFNRGKEFYDQGQYEEAIGAFTAAGEIRPSPILDYNIARCHEKLGNSGEAVAAYERYLKATPGAANREEVERRVAALKRSVEAAPSSGPAPGEPPGEAAPPGGAAVAPSPVPPPSRAEEPGVPAVGSEGGGDPVHEATVGDTAGGKRTARQSARPAPRPNPYRAPGKPDEGPFYKQWWFWVGCAGAAVILGFVIATAASSNDGGSAQTSRGLQITF